MLMMGVNIDNGHSQQQLGKWIDRHGRIFSNILSYKLMSYIITSIVNLINDNSMKIISNIYHVL